MTLARPCACLIVALFASGVLAQDDGARDPAVGQSSPVLRLEAEGPAAYVTALAFGGDGRTLYAGGHDKLVRVWRRDETGDFVYQPDAAIRIPLGPGGAGLINAVAASPDGRWLAIAGQSLARGEAGFQQAAVVLPPAALTAEMRQDRGVIYLYDIHLRQMRALRGHSRPVQSLAFAALPKGEPVLASFAAEEDEGAWKGELGAWRLDREQPLEILPADGIGASGRPPLAVDLTRRDGRFPTNLVVHLANDLNVANGNRLSNHSALLRHWRVGDKTLYAETLPPAVHRFPVVFHGSSRLVVLSYGVGNAAEIQIHERQGEEWRRIGSLLAEKLEVVAAAPVTFQGAEYLAYLAWSPAADDKYRLYLFLYDLNAKALVNRQGARLWDYSTSDRPHPTLAVSPDGGAIAAGPTLSQNIFVYPTEQLLAAGNGRRQELAHAGRIWQGVEFAVRGQSRGLILQDPGAAPERWVFDFEQGEFTSNAADWTPDRARAARWRVTPGVEGSIQTLEVQGPQVRSTIRLKPNQIVTHYALLPSGAAPEVPLVAVAYLDTVQSRPFLALYEVTTGVRFRMYEGHTDRILHVAFSGDGRRLASVAKDRTICVWDVTDVNKVWRQLGQPDGVTVREAGGRLVVDRVETRAFPNGELQEGDEITGEVVDERLQRLASGLAFYARFEVEAPDGSVVLARRRTGEARDARVTVRVAQGIDEQRPLFTLFGQPEQPRWVAWTPSGPYEARGPGAETLAGWHVNTGLVETPVLFTPLDQYKEFSREGLLKSLMETGVIPPPPPPPRPEMNLDVRAGDEAVPGPEYVVQGEHAEVTASFPTVAPQAIARVAWSFAELEGEFKPHPLLPGSWTARIPAPAAVRTQLPLKVTFETREPSNHFDHSATLDFRLPKPTVRWEGAPSVVMEPQFITEAKITPGSPNEPLDVTLLHNEKPVPVKIQDSVIAMNLTLEKGENRLVLEATNRNAPPNARSRETERVARNVFYKPPEPPPEIVVRLQGREASALEPFTALSSELDVEIAVVPASRGIAAVQYRLDDAPPQPFGEAAANGVVQGKIRLTPRDEPPWEQRLAFQVTAADGVAARTTRTIDYRPALPKIEFNLAPGQSTELVRGLRPAKVQIFARLTPGGDPHPYEVELLANGRPETLEPIADYAAPQTILAVASLDPTKTEQEIRLRVHNRWGREADIPPLRVRYLRPPKVAQIVRPVVPAAGFVTLPEAAADLEFLVESPADLPLSLFDHFFLNDAPRRPTALKREPQPAPDGDVRWRVQYEDVALDAERGHLALTVVNRDGRSDPKALAYRIVRRPKTAPKIVLIAPLESSRSQVNVQLGAYVKDTPLESVTVRLNEGEPRVFSLAGEQITRFPKNGKLEVLTLELDRPTNTVEVVAKTVEGETARAERKISLVPPGVQVVIERVGQLTPRQLAEQAISDGVAPLEGHVAWTDPDDPDLQDPELGLHIYVNGFLQFAALETASPGVRKRRFSTEVLLHYSQNNSVRVELPDVRTARSDLARIERVACLNPKRVDRLYLLLVSQEPVEGDADGKLLEREAMSALGARPTPGFAGQYESPAFPEIFPRGPLVGPNLTSEQLRIAVADIKHRITEYLDAEPTPRSVVTMVYFRGSASSDDAGEFALHVSDPDTGSSQLDAQRLHALFQRLPSATLLLLDVVQTRTPLARKNSAWPQNSPLGLLRVRKNQAVGATQASLFLQALTKAGLATSPLSVGRLRTEIPEQLPKDPQLQPVFDFQVLPDLLPLKLR